MYTYTYNVKWKYNGLLNYSDNKNISHINEIVD